jgi:hypothetical protein
MHEDFRREHEVPQTSERKFGIVIGCIASAVALLPLIKEQEPRWWLMVVGLAILSISCIRPALLVPLNRAWTALGRILHKIVSPLVCGILFFAVITPFGLLFRMLGKDPLHLTRSADQETYWMPRERHEPNPQGMKNQF